MNDSQNEALLEEVRSLRSEVRRLKREIFSLSFLGFLGLIVFANNSNILPSLAAAITGAGLVGLLWIGFHGWRARRETKPLPVHYAVTPATPGAQPIPLCTITPESRNTLTH